VPYEEEEDTCRRTGCLIVPYEEEEDTCRRTGCLIVPYLVERLRGQVACKQL
jgi:hypothetical protein